MTGAIPFTNAASTMLYRTWPYGTRKSVKVEDVQPNLIMCFEEASGEAFLLAFGGDTDAKPGDEGYIEFKQGGPTGGYWEFKKGPLLATPG